MVATKRPHPSLRTCPYGSPQSRAPTRALSVAKGSRGADRNRTGAICASPDTRCPLGMDVTTLAAVEQHDATRVMGIDMMLNDSATKRRVLATNPATRPDIVMPLTPCSPVTAKRSVLSVTVAVSSRNAL